MNLATLAACDLDQWALDFRGNLARIRASILEAKARGAAFRLGPELEVTGYGCEDHFLEPDTLRHAWEALAELLSDGVTDDILCDIGMPVSHQGMRHIARVLVHDRHVLLIRPKRVLADGGARFESRWFAPWRRPRATETFELPAVVRDRVGQRTVPIGEALLATRDTVLASVSGEDPFVPYAQPASDAAEIFAAGCASYHELRTSQERLERIRAASEGVGGIHLYADQRGCDGGRLSYAGGAMIVANGEVVAQSTRFSPHEVEVVTATVDLDAVRSLRATRPRRERAAAGAPPLPRVEVDLSLTRRASGDVGREPDRPRPLRLHPVEEEIALAPACWLWDYLRRSGAGGFLLALSGGSDSAAVAMIVASMCDLLLRDVDAHGADGEVGRELRRVLELADDEPLPGDARALAGRLLTTVYLPSGVTSAASRGRARPVATDVGSEHLDLPIEGAVGAFVDGHLAATSGDADRAAPRPRFRAAGGDVGEDLALQNLQARSRLVASYLLAQLTPARHGRRRARMVLGTSNVDEALRGYFTKYDTSSADLNPIGGLSKVDLRRFLTWAHQHRGHASLGAILAAPPSAELTPETDQGPQSDEREMGLTYEELAVLGRLRKVERCGPLATFERLLDLWETRSPREVADKVRLFYRAYAAHRHKATVLTPAHHAAAYGADDHRGDLRPFLLDTDWRWQFDAIERRLGEAGNAPRPVAEGGG